MSRQRVKKLAHKLMEKYNASSPYELCDYLEVPIYYMDLGKNILGFRSVLNRAPVLLLNIRNSEEEEYIVCIHELGYHCCGRTNNTGQLTRNSMRFIAQGDEYEANCLMIKTLLYGVNLAEYPTKECLLRNCGIPSWAEHYVDWKYLEETTNFDSYNSYY